MRGYSKKRNIVNNIPIKNKEWDYKLFWYLWGGNINKYVAKIILRL